jgi:hypothetical protein
MHDASLPLSFEAHVFEAHVFEAGGGIATATAMLRSHCSNPIEGLIWFAPSAKLYAS